jgi:DNA-binding SARP family transcriptional activator
MLLGDFDARFDGHPVTGAFHNKMRALLGYLVMEREREHSREMLANLLWDDKDAAIARDNLRRTLLKLRKALEPASGPILFSATKHTIRFIPNAYIDALDFTDQAAAAPENSGTDRYREERLIALYRGEFLSGLSLPGCPDFEDWLKIQRETLRRRALALLEQLSNRYAQIDDYGKALQFALRLTEMEPWDESAHRKAMRFYALNGQNSAALQQYETCCRLLKTELAVLPSAETQQLAANIRSGGLRLRHADAVKTPPPQTIRQTAYERRQVTVLYCELIPASIIDDPDEAMEQLRAPLARCEKIIRQFSGHTVQTYDGGLLAYFGYPQAREDAAQRAVTAALAVTRETTPDIRIHAAVHTGLAISGGEAAKPDTVGLASKLTIQLRHNTAQKEVAISQETYRLVGGYFDCVSLGVQTLPGFARPVEVFKVMRESGARSRLDAAVQLTPLAGRQTEIAGLMGLWEQAAQGISHAVLIQGEAGIGKSRLLHTLKQRLFRQSNAIHELRCFPEFSQSPFYPLIALLEGIFRFDPNDTPETKSVKLVRHLEAHYPASAANAAPLLSQLLSLPLAGPYQALDFSPQNLKEQFAALLLELLQADSARLPILLIVEDLHWIDPSSLEVLTLLIELQTQRPILALFTARPEFAPPWKDALISMLMLAPLAGDEVAKIIDSISKDIPAATLRRIVKRADGIPLFAEEMAKIAHLNNQASIPATLHDLLAARIDNTGEARYTAQLAATLGREFDLDLLRKVSSCEPAALAHNLAALQDAGVILTVNETTRQFKHALLQKAAYQSQTKAGRQDAHRRIAQTLLADFPDVATAQPELLARHLSSGGDARQAIEYWIKAGQRAVLNSANAEAIEHFNNGLELLTELPSDNDLDPLEVELRLSLGTALIAAKGYGSIEIGQTYSRAQELCERLGDDAGLFTALWGRWLTSSSRVGHLHSLELAKKLLHLAERNNDQLQLQQALYAMGNSLLWTGRPELARRHLERSMALYQPSHHEAMVRNSGENICVSSGALLTLTLWLLGYPKQAEDAGQRTLALARQANHPHSLGFALCTAATLNRWMNQTEATSLLAQAAMTLSHEHGTPLWLGLGTATYGWTLARQDQAAGIAHIQQCLEAVNAVMSGISGLFLALLIEARLALRQFADALAETDGALYVMNAKDDRFFASEFHRLKGVCLLGISGANLQQAEACFNLALAISREQGAKSLELRAAMDMARLWQQQGKQKDARRLLKKIYNGFNEGFDTFDLQEAEILLRQLAQSATSPNKHPATPLC